ncbi:hypothetical protein HIM_10614 [Hirsutella minnesotensis 3608]|uniref:Uncharacterized protein n=1 Tax=Hirsutella minnesotensis 3608 TaxID=1043627 RepID=A0A0F7ZRQ1_9HYPO|nr:hypothetical protein HIM_10614 [Hirsutella minnesotensis 3608]
METPVAGQPAVRVACDFRLTFLPHFSLNLATDQVIQPHGLDLANTRHIPLGTFSTPSVRFTVYLFFPDSTRSSGPLKSTTSNALSLERQKDLYDKIIIPAAYEAVRDPIRQEIPRTFDMVYAKSRSYQERPGMGRWSAEDESRAYQLTYSIPAGDLPLFWQSIVAKANQLRIQTRRGEPAAYFKNPQLLMQAHDLKNTFAAPTLNETLSRFEWTVLAFIDPDKVDTRSCWIDAGARDIVTNLGTPELRRTDPFTLLWKSQCNGRLHKRLLDAAPDTLLADTHYRSFLLRDTGNLTSTVRRTKTPNVGHPASRQTGVARAKAYASNKELFSVMFSNYGLFSSGFLPLLALDEDMMRDLASVTKERECGYETRLNRRSLHKAWEANKRHLKAISDPQALTNYGLRKEMTLRLDTVLTMWSRGAFDPAQNPHTGSVSCVLGTQAGVNEPHYPFWVVPTRDINALIFTQAARLVLPLDHLFKEASPSPSSALHNPAEGPIRRILAFYTAQLFCRLLVHSLSSQRAVNYDKWMFLSRWRARAKGRTFHERRGLGLEAPIKASGMLWMPRGVLDWQGGHLALERLIELYIPRNPLQTRLASQNNIQALTTSQVTVEFFLKEWHRDAKQAFKDGRKKEGRTIANRIVKLCAEEIARAYHQHMLRKLERFWELAREGHGRSDLPKLAVLKRAQEDAAAEVGQIVTAQTIWEIYSEAWTSYATALRLDGADGGSVTPAELPCWMKTRKHYIPPNDGWSEYVFAHLFGREKAPAWDGRSHFLQVYRSFKNLWTPISESAGQFDNRLKSIIGTFILVTFNSNNTKEVGTNHYQGTWYHGKPTFFQVQFRAPYFSSPQDSHDLRLDAVCSGTRLPGDLGADAAPRVLTADKFQQLERAAHQDWVRLMGSEIEEASEEERNRHCRRALRHMILLVGPNWASDKRVEHVVPWRYGKDDFLRLPVEAARSMRDSADDLLCEPTVLLPTRHNVMKVMRRIESFSDLGTEAKQRLKWARRRLNNGGNQYDLRTHLEAKEKAAGVTRQSPSLLRQFLSQTEPPQWCVQRGELDEAETDSESGWCGSETEEDVPDVSDDLASLVYDNDAE